MMWLRKTQQGVKHPGQFPYDGDLYPDRRSKPVSSAITPNWVLSDEGLHPEQNQDYSALRDHIGHSGQSGAAHTKGGICLF